jgi:hypothetical protein
VRAPAGLVAGALAFLVVATANSGGYRFGISDQAFYLPAIALTSDESLFPADREILLPQMRLWLGDDVFAAALDLLPLDLPQLFVLLYAAGVLALFGAGVFLARGLGASWWAVAGAAALLTLRHRIAKTGANSLEGYMHPRMMAFALGLVAFGFIVRRRLLPAAVFVALALVVHTTTGLWFAAATGIAAIALTIRRSFLTPAFLAVAAAATAIIGYLFNSQRMDAEWLAVLGEKDYLFPHAWPVYAWAINLLYPVVLVAMYRRRSRLGIASPAEWSLVLGLLTLVAGFLVSVPLAAGHIALVVELQVNRVFWLLDAVALIYLAWWLIDDLGARRKLQAAVAAVLVVLACGRGVYILAVTGRPIARLNLPPDEWTDALRWIREQSRDWHVLADPGHAWKYGTSVRVAALRDSTLEAGKDAALAMYAQSTARRVSERARALAGFDTFDAMRFRAVARQFDADVLVLENTRPVNLPRMYANARFAVYDLR